MPIDYKKYPTDWQARRKRILERDEYRCTQCGAQNYDQGLHDELGHWWPQSRLLGDMRLPMLLFSKQYNELDLIMIVLTVAHLDHDEHNWNVQDDRLAAMCQICHLRYDAADNANRRRYGKYYKHNQLNLF